MIRAEGVSKYYGGKRALGPVSFSIDKGETVGFLGLNGAGKTTALRVLACDLRPSGGTISVGDVDIVKNPKAVRKRIGFLPETPPLYSDMYVHEFLRFAGRIRGMSKSEIDKRFDKVVEQTGIREVLGLLVRELSSGYRQRVGVAQAIIHDPMLLILDEPTRSLDPVQIVEMRSLIGALKEDHTVLISSHILTEISKTCDRLLVLGNGEIIAQGSQEEIHKMMAPLASKDATPFADVTIAPLGSEASPKDFEKFLGSLSFVTNSEMRVATDDELTFRVAMNEDNRADLAKELVEKGYSLIGLGLVKHSDNLEDAFVELVGKGGDHGNN